MTVAMPRRLTLVVLFLTPTLACTMWKNPARGWSGATGGEQLEKLFWEDVQAKKWAQVDKRVAETFAGASPAGTLDRAAFLQDLQAHEFTAISVSGCTSKLNGADFVITCVARRQGAGGSAGAAATLSIWQQLKRGWVMVAHSESPLAAR
jgi:hypothetical protein